MISVKENSLMIKMNKFRKISMKEPIILYQNNGNFKKVRKLYQDNLF